MKTLLVIMAHGDYLAQAAFNRHLPFWRAHGADMIVMCPTDSEVKSGLEKLLIGKRCHHGPEANRRFRKMLDWLSGLEDYDRFIIFEYDAICLQEKLPEFSGPCGFRGIRHDNVDSQYSTKEYFHPPLVIDAPVLGQLARCPLADHEECGMWDRWLARALNMAGINAEGFGALGYSENTIEPRHLREAIAAVENGAIMLHGIKTAATLDALVAAYVNGRMALAV